MPVTTQQALASIALQALTHSNAVELAPQDLSLSATRDLCTHACMPDAAGSGCWMSVTRCSTWALLKMSRRF